MPGKQLTCERVTIFTMGLAVWLAGPAGVRGDSVESTTGATIHGKVISRDDQAVVMEVQVSGKTVQRRYPLSLIRAITIDDRREVLKPGGASTEPQAGSPAGAQRTREDIDKLIADQGSKPPDWLATTASNLPRSLDLNWPEPAEGPWNNQKNVGQFVWDVINPNPNRWREGIKLMMQLRERHGHDEEKSDRAARELGSMYHRFFQDYPRAAYWWQQTPDWEDEVGVAECYWRLGSKSAALELLEHMDYVPVEAIKLYADMGETDRALKLVKLFESGNAVDWAYVNAGDACRSAGRAAEAIRYYEKVLALPSTDRNRRNQARARASIESVKLFDTLDLKRVADGTYTSSSLGYEAPVIVQVRVRGGRIETVKVSEHREKQFYSAITDTTRQIIQKQSVKGIDATSRATITSEAITHATAKALHSGMK